MNETYKATEVRKPGEFVEVRRPLQDPGYDQVRILRLAVRIAVVLGKLHRRGLLRSLHEPTVAHHD